MRARLGLATALWASGALGTALEYASNMLQLNSGDECIPRPLSNSLRENDDCPQIDRLLNNYRNGCSVKGSSGRARYHYRPDGDWYRSHRSRGTAAGLNPFVSAYLAGRERLPARFPSMIGWADQSAAISCAAVRITSWCKTPQAGGPLQASDKRKPARAKDRRPVANTKRLGTTIQSARGSGRPTLANARGANSPCRRCRAASSPKLLPRRFPLRHSTRT